MTETFHVPADAPVGTVILPDAPSYQERYKLCSIELDCPPGPTRPSNLISRVLGDSGLIEDDFDTDPPFFGHQTWVLKPSVWTEKSPIFAEHKPNFKERVTALYNDGFIRYGTW